MASNSFLQHIQPGGALNSIQPYETEQLTTNDLTVVLGLSGGPQGAYTLATIRDLAQVTFLYPTEAEDPYAALRGIIATLAWQFTPRALEFRQVGNAAGFSDYEIGKHYNSSWRDTALNSTPFFPDAVPGYEAIEFLTANTLGLHATLVAAFDDGDTQFTESIPYGLRVVHTDDLRIDSNFYEIAAQMARGVNGRQGFIYVAPEGTQVGTDTVIYPNGDGTWTLQTRDSAVTFEPFSVAIPELPAVVQRLDERYDFFQFAG
jgi:hypothetical protein